MHTIINYQVSNYLYAKGIKFMENILTSALLILFGLEVKKKSVSFQVAYWIAVVVFILTLFSRYTQA